MGYFWDTDHLYEVLGALFTRLRDEEAIAEKLLEGNLTIQFFGYKDQNRAEWGQLTVGGWGINCRQIKERRDARAWL